MMTTVGDADPITLGFAPERLSRLNLWMTRYVEGGKLPFAATLINRHGRTAYFEHSGWSDIAAGIPWRPDHVIRMYSMTKPLVCAAAMMLFEDGLFYLDEPVSAFLPEFSKPSVLIPGAERLDQAEPARHVMTMHDLFTHCAGFTYSFNGDILGKAYDRDTADFAPGAGPLKEAVKRLAALPLLYEPGRRWMYSVAHDVLGRVVEVISGQPLDRFFQERIFGPLGMPSACFEMKEGDLSRLCTLYASGDDGAMRAVDTPAESRYRPGQVTTLSGGGGVLSTLEDFMRFAEMLRRRGRIGEGKNEDWLLSPRTVDLMTANHLGGDIAAVGPEAYNSMRCTGLGYGLGVCTMVDPARARVMGSPGDYGWGGMANTVFWVDPALDMVVIFVTQFAPSSQMPQLRKQLRSLVYQAVVA